MEYDPEVVVLDDKEDGLSGRGVHQLISSLKSSFRLPDFNKVEEYLTLREQQLKQEKDELEAKMKKISDGLLAEIQKKEIENEFLERKHADEVLEKLVLEEDLRKCKRECEDLEEKVNRLSEDQKVMCGREKRAEERYGKLMEELKKSEECSAQLNCKNRELECEKRRIEAEIEMWKRRFGELESRVLALEKDTEVLKRPEPNFCESMKGNLGVRNPGFSEWRAEKEAGSLRKVKNEMDIDSTSVSLENKKINEISAKNIHASPEEIQPAVNDGGPDLGEESHLSASSGRSPVDDAACISASPFSYAELEEMLKRIPPRIDVALPSAKMFEAAETLVSGIRGMVQQRDLFSNLLRTADYMKTFVSQRMNSEEKLRLKLEQAEACLSATRRASEESVEALKRSQEDNEALRMELAEAKSREESTNARLHKAEGEMAQLRGEVRQLRTKVSIEKKQKEDLQLRLSAQKEELEAEFDAQREELEADYQKQVDEMYFFGYRCCMKKHGIKRDVPSIPPGEEDKLRGKPSQ